MFRSTARSLLKPLFERFGYPVYTARFGPAKGLKVTGDLGFLQFGYPAVPEEDFLGNLDLEGKTVYDIGAHIGILTMFFSRSVGRNGQVVAFEPNPETCTMLHKNLELNGLKNVTVAQIGLGERRETRILLFDVLFKAAGSMDDAIKEELSRRRGSKISRLQIEVHRLDNYIRANHLPLLDFGKIDVEGMEYNVLLGMTDVLDQKKPALFIEIHGAGHEAKLVNIQRVVEFLDAWGYDIYHVESDQAVSKDTAYIAKEGHIYCT